MNKRISIIGTGLYRFTGKLKPVLVLVALVASISGCASFNNFFGSSGPSSSQIQDMHDDPRVNGMQLVTVDDSVANKLKARRKKNLFSDSEQFCPIFGTSKKSICKPLPKTVFGQSFFSKVMYRMLYEIKLGWVR